MPEVHATNGTVIAQRGLEKIVVHNNHELGKELYHQLPVKRRVAVLERMKQEITA